VGIAHLLFGGFTTLLQLLFYFLEFPDRMGLKKLGLTATPSYLSFWPGKPGGHRGS